MSDSRKTAIVTGASQGIDAGIVKAFVERGFDVVANSRKVNQSTEVAASNHVALVNGHIGEPATAARIVETALSRFKSIDALAGQVIKSRVGREHRRCRPPGILPRSRYAIVRPRPWRNRRDCTALDTPWSAPPRALCCRPITTRITIHPLWRQPWIAALPRSAVQFNGVLSRPPPPRPSIPSCPLPRRAG